MENKKVKKVKEYKGWKVGETYDCSNGERYKIISIDPNRLYELEAVKEGTICHERFSLLVAVAGVGYSYAGIEKYFLCRDFNLTPKPKAPKVPKANKSFIRGKFYKNLAGNEFIFIKRFKTRRGIFGIFESDNEKRSFCFTAPIYRYNGVEVTFDYGELDFIADESIRQLEIKETDCKRIKE